MKQFASKYVYRKILAILSVFILINFYFSPAANAQQSIAVADSLAGKAAEKILNAGGNAVDAGIAALLALAVVEPFSTGLGGDGLFLVQPKNSQAPIFIDARGTAPLGVDAKLFYDKAGDFDFYTSAGRLSLCVPGILAGAEIALKKYGSMSWDQVAAPAIEFANKGFPMSRSLHELLVKNYDKIMGNSHTFSYFFPDWVVPETGEQVSFPDLANSLKKIAANGSAAFYRGSLADLMSNDLEGQNSIIRAPDFFNYKSEEKKSLSIQFRGRKIAAAPLPSVGGLTLLTMLKMLEQASPDSFAVSGGEQIVYFVQKYQRALALVGKFLLEKREISVAQQQSFLDNFNPKIAHLEKIETKNFAPLLFHEGQGAATIAIVDAQKNSVVISSALNDYFGSKLMTQRSGILFNNGMNSFSPLSGVPNSIRPESKPYTWLTPVIVSQGNRPVLLLSANGAERNVLTFAQLIFYFFSKKSDPLELVKMPRFHYDALKNLVELESRFSAQAMEYLKNNGYKIDLKVYYDVYFGNCQVAFWDETQAQYRSISDVRREGVIYLED